MTLASKIQVIDRSYREEARGWFLKVLTGKEDFLPEKVGEVYLTMARPGEFRANHYHLVTAEWFTVISGEATVLLKDMVTNERLQLKLVGAEPKTLFVPAGIAHTFINASPSEELLLVVYAENKYDPADTVLHDLLVTSGAQ
jgi:dTDP-4-dehydrorhamnose 3,5-epimerase-like enzyme